MMEEGVWVEYEDLKAWVSSHHLVHEKYLMLQRLYERRKESGEPPVAHPL